MSWFIAALKKYAVFRGRARRKEFWLFVLFTYIAYGVLGGIGVATHSSAFLAGLGIAVVALLLPTWGVTVRRLHGTGRSGWWILIHLIPTFGAITLLVICSEDGKRGVNKYGPNPKEVPAFALTPRLPYPPSSRRCRAASGITPSSTSPPRRATAALPQTVRSMGRLPAFTL